MRVDRYTPDQVRTRPLADTKLGPMPTAETFGAGLGQTLGQAGGAVAQEALRQRAEQQARMDDLAVTTAERQFNQLESVYLHSPDKGILHMVGKTPYERRDTAFEEWDQQAGEIVKAATTERQQAALTRMQYQRRASFVDRVNNHASQQFQTYEAKEYDAARLSTVNTAVAAADGTPDGFRAISEQLQRQGEIVLQMSARLGYGPEQQAKLLQDTRALTHVGVIEQLISKEQDVQAEAYFQNVVARKELTEGQEASLRTKLEVSSRESKAFATANALYEQHAPAPGDDVTPFPLDVAEREARALAGNDPKLYQLTVNYLRDRNAGVEAARADRKSARATTVWAAIDRGASEAAVRQLPEYRTNPGEMHWVSEHFQQQRDRALNRALAADSRARAAADRAEREADKKSWSAYYTLLVDPTTFAKLPEGDVAKLLPTLGPEVTAKLVSQHRQLQNATALSTATIDADQFKTIAFNNGVPWIYDKDLSTEQKANVGRLQHMVQEEIARQESGGKKLSYEQKGAAMKQVLDQKVTLTPGGWTGFWYGPTEVSVALVANPEDQQRARVPLKHIPTDYLPSVLNTLRAVRPWLAKQDDDYLTTHFRDVLESAAAAWLLGLGDEEVLKRLKGTL
jgi:hypothetical protein